MWAQARMNITMWQTQYSTVTGSSNPILLCRRHPCLWCRAIQLSRVIIMPRVTNQLECNTRAYLNMVAAHKVLSYFYKIFSCWNIIKWSSICRTCWTCCYAYVRDLQRRLGLLKQRVTISSLSLKRLERRKNPSPAVTEPQATCCQGIHAYYIVVCIYILKEMTLHS